MSGTVLYSDIVKGFGPKPRPADIGDGKQIVQIQPVSSAHSCSLFGLMFLWLISFGTLASFADVNGIVLTFSFFLYVTFHQEFLERLPKPCQKGMESERIPVGLNRFTLCDFLIFDNISFTAKNFFFCIEIVDAYFPI